MPLHRPLVFFSILFLMGLSLGQFFQSPSENGTSSFRAKAPRGALDVRLDGFRQRLLRIHEQTLPQPYPALLSSMIFGNAAAPVPDEIQTAYRKTGMLHLLVASGAQVALLIGLAVKAAELFRWSSVVSFLWTSLWIWGFTALAGFQPSIVRAAIMGEIALAGRLLGRDTDGYTSMAASAIVLFLWDPLLIHHPGVHLSFAATWSLLYLAPALEKTFQRMGGMPTSSGGGISLIARFATPLSLVLGPFLGTLPLTWFHFSTVSIAALPMNFLILSAVEVLLVTGLIATILGFVFLPLALFFNGFNFCVLWIINTLVLTVSHWPYTCVYLPTPHWTLVLLMYAMAVCFVETVHHPKWIKPFRRLLGLTMIGLFLWALLAFLPSSTLSVTMLDVGQGDSLLIDTPHHRHILIDAGDPMAGKYQVLPALRKKGINRLDLLVVTHPHSDHAGGVPAITANILVSKAWTIDSAWAGQGVTIDSVGFRILAPVSSAQARAETDLNNASIVIRMTYKDASMLFTGDLPSEKEAILVREHPELLPATVLKVGHHGSRGSSSDRFLSAVAPRVALISCKKQNRYHHPHRDTLNRLRNHGVQIFRTDQMGTITVRTNGKQVWVNPDH